MDVAPVVSPGSTIAGTYVVERLLAKGGMGEVWLAKHTRLSGKQVAIKVLKFDRAPSADLLTRFRREAEIAAKLEHPNIVQVFDFDTLPNGQPFMVMEYLKGRSLAARLREGRMPLEQVLDVIRQVGAALSVAHKAGVVHRDLKPDNIFLQPTGVGELVKVLDFGISKLIDATSVNTRDSVLMGTPLYMSPEQAQGKNRALTAQSDVFSLAAIAYEMLAGVPPHVDENLARLMYRVAFEQPVPLSTLRDDLPNELIAAVNHALAKDTSQRTIDVYTFVAELTGRPVTAENLPVDTPGFMPGAYESQSMISGQTRKSGIPSTTPPQEEAKPHTAPVAAPTGAVAHANRSRLARWGWSFVVLALMVAVVVGGITLRNNSVGRSALDALYAKNHEPVPPVGCQETDTRVLAQVTEAAVLLQDSIPEENRATAGVQALRVLEPLSTAAKTSPEAAYFIARARAQADQPFEESFETAIKCEGFAAALNFGAAQAAKQKRLDEATSLAQRARKASGTFSKPLLTQAVIEFQLGKVDSALMIINAFLEEQPESADGHYALGLIRLSKATAMASMEQKKDAETLQEAARNAFCTAAKMGHAKAKDMCRDTSQ